MPINESLELILSIVNTHYEERKYKEWLLGSVVNGFSGDKLKSYTEFLGIKNTSNFTSSKSVDEIKKENEEILNNFFK
ncbi:hypothetical protein [Clostridium sp.]|uniref:hypothetical protein n=1 Tax=Clostridium sp. TaxID=1506 RepID=UPI00291508ED|nr:hypothetical protein [Clostridium sp.]MDU7212477.1 hypothetical protein [Clostridium sp.]